TDRGDPDNCTGAPCDGAETSSTETVSITVDPVNDTPVATAGARTTAEDTPVALDLADLASDTETADGNLTYEIVTQPANATATATTYTPDGHSTGSGSLRYRSPDRGAPDSCPAAPCAGIEPATGRIQVTGGAVNDPPV